MSLSSVPQKQHLVSQVLLRRFVDPTTGMLVSFDLRSAKSFDRSPAAVCYEIGFIKDDAAGAELRWKLVEDQLPAAFDALDAGIILDTPEHVHTMKQAIALHWARSRTVLEIDRALRDRAVGAVRAQLVNELPHRFAEEFYRRYGFLPAGHEALMHIAGQLLPRDEGLLDRFFTERVYLNFDAAMLRLASQQLEIGEATEDAEFIVGDVPTLTLRPDRLAGGPLGGVPWNEATTVVLPLGPKHMAGIGKATGWHPFDASQVERLNTAQVLSALERVVYRPGAGLSPWIAATRSRMLLSAQPE